MFFTTWPNNRLLWFLCNSFGSGLVLLELEAQVAVTELQPRLGTVSSVLPHGCLEDTKGDTKGHFRDTSPIKPWQLCFFQASDYCTDNAPGNTGCFPSWWQTAVAAGLGAWDLQEGARAPRLLQAPSRSLRSRMPEERFLFTSKFMKEKVSKTVHL